jgi:hypothetical protein
MLDRLWYVPSSREQYQAPLVVRSTTAALLFDKACSERQTGRHLTERIQIHQTGVAVAMASISGLSNIQCPY